MGDALYTIKESTLTAIADRTRALSNTTEKLTPDDIVYWLGRVKVFPSGAASSTFTLNFETNAIGVLKEE